MAGSSPSLKDSGLKTLAPESRVFSRFVLERQLPAGSFAAVWVARDEISMTRVALKFLSERLARDPVALADLRLDVQQAATLRHASIAMVHDLREHGPLVALRTEFIDAPTLAERQAERADRCFDPAELLPWFEQLGRALTYAHTERHLVHRAIKPALIAVAKSGHVVALDFAIAHALDEAAARHGGAAAGSAAYLSPQQRGGAVPQVSDDIYALGATLYDLLTGAPPQRNGTAEIPRINVRRGTVQPMRQPISARWEQTIARCLAAEPAQRPGSIAEVIEALRIGVNEPAAADPPPKRAGKGVAAAAIISEPVEARAEAPSGAAAALRKAPSIESKAAGVEEKTAPLAAVAAPVTTAAPSPRETAGAPPPSAPTAAGSPIPPADAAPPPTPRKPEAQSPPTTPPAEPVLITPTPPKASSPAPSTVSPPAAPAPPAAPYRPDFEVAKLVTQQRKHHRGIFIAFAALIAALLLGRFVAERYLPPASPVAAAPQKNLVVESDRTTSSPAASQTAGPTVSAEPEPVPEANPPLLATTAQPDLEPEMTSEVDEPASPAPAPAPAETPPAPDPTPTVTLSPVQPPATEAATVASAEASMTIPVEPLPPVEPPLAAEGARIPGLPPLAEPASPIHAAPEPSPNIALTDPPAALLPLMPETSAPPTATPEEAPRAEPPRAMPVASSQPPKAGRRWTNTLGMPFAPVPKLPVLVAIWETRVRDFEVFVKATGLDWVPPDDSGPDHPVVNISYLDATLFCEWLTVTDTEAKRLKRGQHYRLPTDREWSTCAGIPPEPGETLRERDDPKDKTFPWGTKWPAPPEAGNYRGFNTPPPGAGEVNADFYAGTSPVGSFAANQFGLFDLGGNAAEMVSDFISPEMRIHATRGGSYRDSQERLLRLRARGTGEGDRGAAPHIGFRVVLDPGK